MNTKDRCRVWAPATVANLNVGFDALGCALCSPGEFMDFKRLDPPGVHLVNGPGTDLPLDVESNVAGKAAASLLHALGNPFGVEVTVTKSIMPGSGIGSSAASAVAAVVGVDALAGAGMRKDELLPFALDGEAVASGARHADNVAPALMGGLTLIDPDGKVCALPVPNAWHLVVLHPQVVIKTAESRAALPSQVSLADATHQAAWLGRFVHELHSGNDVEAMFSLADLLVAPHRGPLMPHWKECQQAAQRPVHGPAESVAVGRRAFGCAGPPKRRATWPKHLVASWPTMAWPTTYTPPPFQAKAPMLFRSLTDPTIQRSFAQAVIEGLAPDKGLYFPDRIPLLDKGLWLSEEDMQPWELGAAMMAPFTEEDLTQEALGDILKEVLNFPLDLVEIHDNVFALELFHGPTHAFKDVGARFLSRVLRRITNQRLTILVATSGDTGSAVAQGFLNVPNIDVVILYPQGRISKIQEQQLTTAGANIRALEVEGAFDDCQAMVKAAFLDADLQAQRPLTSANSINVARWMPQGIYYAWATHVLGRPIQFSVPSGNVGNLAAGVLAAQMGMPHEGFVAASNANAGLAAFLKG